MVDSSDYVLLKNVFFKAQGAQHEVLEKETNQPLVQNDYHILGYENGYWW